ncbi:immunoglobulin superfamily member 6 isoform X3 [Microtus oregoni]|uniref:immunoglobulin superfamily member 6 isoform X3 n=1 Tax=Microtus oregoni TaxID=111838 RepID=UPI001BB1939E|nr:immunoglobulin superfamily member 6 isoform X3 [Microtus oregoni]
MPSTCRVMGPVSTSKIGLPLEISLILFHVGVVGACTVSVVQPRYLEVDYTSETVTLECTFSTTGCSSKQPRSLWFRCGAHQPEALCLDGCRNKADKFTVEETLDQNRVSLTVNRVSPNDSAIYICGIAFPHEPAPRAKQTGSGTTLVVREGLLSREVHSLLIVIIALFSIYIAGVCVIFIVLFRSKSNSSRSRETKEDSQKKSARRIFREIAQELYHKRYVETCQQPVSPDNQPQLKTR